MNTRAFHLLKLLLVLMVSALITGCVTTPPPKSPIEVPRVTAAPQPIVEIQVGLITVKDSTHHETVGWTGMKNTLDQIYLSKEDLEKAVRETLMQANLFGQADGPKFEMEVEVLDIFFVGKEAWINDPADVTMRFKILAPGGELLFDRTLKNRGQMSGDEGSMGWGITNPRKAIKANLVELVSILPETLKKYAKKEEMNRRLTARVKSSLKSEHRYFRVVSSTAVVRYMPDAQAREVASLPQADLVHVTGSLPSGWLQVSQEGKPIGWVHSSLLREDLSVAPSYKPAQQVLTPALVAAPKAPATFDVASLDFGAYHALVVGNNDYQHLPKLHTAINDAHTIASLLQNKYGYKVRLLTNATRAEILTAINDYRRTLTIYDNLLIYYAGHGWLDKDAGQGYWLPVDATRETQVKWVSNSAITSEIRAIQAKHVMVVADSCYSGKLTRGLHITNRTPDYLARMSRKKARVVLSSGGLEPVMDSGGKGNHSIFASAFIEALSENNNVLDGTSLFTRIRERVGWNADQTPEYANIHKAGHDGGDFLFVKQKR